MIGKSVGVVLAGGHGKRMHREVAKQYLPVNGKPMIWYSLDAFERSPVESVVLVVPPGDIEYCRKEIVEAGGFKKVGKIVEGGEHRYDSVYAALVACKNENYDLILVHDGARPVVTVEIITEALNAAQAYGGCVIAVPVKDTIKVSDEKGYAVQTIPREMLWCMQTPQAFRFDILKSSYDKMMEDPANSEGITDDAMVVERFSSCRVKLNMGDYRNIKVTTPEDLVIASAYLRED